VPVEGLPSIGDANALVTIVVFTDYECPFCRKVEGTISKLRAKYGEDVRLVYGQHPLPMHDHARPAALASLAAAAQGRFEAMHARLFEAKSLDEAGIQNAARAAGLDLVRFERDRTSDATMKALVDADGLATKIGVKGTPTFFVNGQKVVGNQPYETFERVVGERLASARALAKTGVRPSRIYETIIASGVDRVPDEVRGGSCGEKPGCAHEEKDAIEAVRIDGDPSRGPASAPITIVTFGDFECPFSARAAETLHAVEKEHPGQVRVVFKQRPLPFHENARLAAKASLAAAAQGHFWEYHDALFAHADALDRASLEKYARTAGLDVARFTRDLDSPALDAQLEADIADAEALKIEGTPTSFINGRRLMGAQPTAAFDALIVKK
jgi:protein-disulfide isomerase